MPNEDVKLAVLSCIGKVPIEQIERDEMGLLVKFLADSKNIGAGAMEHGSEQTTPPTYTTCCMKHVQEAPFPYSCKT